MLTALNYAISSGHVIVVKLLLQYERTAPCDAWRALYCAAYLGHKDIIALLVDKGYHITASENDKCVLNRAILNGDDHVILTLAEFGVKGCHGSSALHVSAIHGRDKLIKDLVKIDPRSINSKDEFETTAVVCAVKQLHTKCVTTLLELGADVDLTDDVGRTSLMHSVISGSRKIFEKLLDKQCGTDVLDKFGYSALHYAVSGREYDVVRLLLSYGCDVNISGQYQTTALHIAVKSGDIEAVEILLECDNININALDSWGRTVVFYAIIFLF